VKYRFAAVAIACALAIAACGGSGGSASPEKLQVSKVRDAVAAVEAKLGGPQRFFEVNATPTLVNVFVASQDATSVTTYVYVGAELQVAQDAEPASGATFAASEMNFDAAHVLDQVRRDLPKTTLRAFSIVGLDGGGAGYVVTVESDLGGILEIPIQANGTVIRAGG
jgi:hypothetical protein